MKRGRPAEGSKVVEGLEGSEEAKRKLRAVLESVAGDRPVEEICAELKIGKTAFYELRAKVLAAALAGSEPKAAGRPRRVMTAEEKDNAKLKNEIEDLRTKLEVAYVREEIMLGMPEAFEPLKKKRREQLRRGQKQPQERAIIEWDGSQASGVDRAGATAPPGAGADRGGEGKKD